MARKKYDLRTEREKLRDEQCEVIAKRFRELMPYAPNATRVVNTIAQELGIMPSTVRTRATKMGIYTPCGKKGEKGTYKVNL